MLSPFFIPYSLNSLFSLSHTLKKYPLVPLHPKKIPFPSPTTLKKTFHFPHTLIKYPLIVPYSLNDTRLPPTPIMTPLTPPPLPCPYLTSVLLTLITNSYKNFKSVIREKREMKMREEKQSDVCGEGEIVAIWVWSKLRFIPFHFRE